MIGLDTGYFFRLAGTTDQSVERLHTAMEEERDVVLCTIAIYVLVRHRTRSSLDATVVNLVLAVVFAPLLLLGLAGFSGILLTVGTYGVAVNLLLAAFNLIPFGPLDGATVRAWSTPVWLGVFIPSAVLAVLFAFMLI